MVNTRGKYFVLTVTFLKWCFMRQHGFNTAVINLAINDLSLSAGDEDLGGGT